MSREKLILKKNKIEHYIKIENIYYTETLNDLKCSATEQHRSILHSNLKSSIRRLDRYSKKLDKINKKLKERTDNDRPTENN